MKRCPTCTRVYDGDDLRFCLDDGTLLVDKPSESPAPATQVLPVPQENQPTMTAAQPPPRVHDHIPPTVAAPRTQKRNLLVWIIVIALLVPFLGGAGLGAWALFGKKQALRWHLVLQVDTKSADRATVIRQTVAVIERRLDAAGVSNYEVKPQDDGTSGRILINLPSLDDPERLKQLIATQGKLELVHVISPPSPAPVQTYATKAEALTSLNSSGSIPENRRVLPYTERDESNGNGQNAQKWVVVESPAIIGGNDLRTADAVLGVLDHYQVAFSLNKNGADKFGRWTGANINEYLGVVLNDEVKSIAFIKSQITDQGQIDGRFTKRSAEDLALVLKAGALPAPVTLVEETVDK